MLQGPKLQETMNNRIGPGPDVRGIQSRAWKNRGKGIQREQDQGLVDFDPLWLCGYLFGPDVTDGVGMTKLIVWEGRECYLF